MKCPHATFFNVGVLVLLTVLGNLEKVSAGRYCGSELSKALAMLCSEFYTLEDLTNNKVGFYSPMDQFQSSQSDWAGENFYENGLKRSFNVPADANQLQAVYDPYEPRQWFKQKPFHRFIVPHMQARFRRNVADECCRQDCSMTQLLSYCKVVAPGVIVT